MQFRHSKLNNLGLGNANNMIHKHMIWIKYMINAIKKYMINTLAILYVTRGIKCLRWKEYRFGTCVSIRMFWKYSFFSLNLIFYFISEYSRFTVLVSGIQQSVSMIHIHVPFFFRFLPHVDYYRLLSSFLCHTVGACSLSI